MNIWLSYLSPLYGNMRKIILIITLLFVSACFWDQGNSGGGGGETWEPGASNIFYSKVIIPTTKINGETEGRITISNSYEEDADVHVKLATDDGITSGEIFELFSSDCGSLRANSFILKSNQSCEYFYKFKPKAARYYTGVVSVDIIGKSYYETGKIANKKRFDAYLVGAGAVDPEDKKTLPSPDYEIEFNGVHGYYSDNNQPENAYKFDRPYITLNFKNVTTGPTTYVLEGYNEASAEFKLKFLDDKVDCKINNNEFYLAKDAICNLNLEYIPRSKSERGQLYIIPKNGAAVQRLFFFGQAYPFRFMENGQNMDWGDVGVNFKLADTLLDLKEKIAYGENLTENFENTFDALITLKGNADNETKYKLEFDQTKDFVLDQKLTDCTLNSDHTIITVKKGTETCNLIVAFTPQEARNYTSALAVTNETTGVVSRYNFSGKGVNLRRPDLVPYYIMLSDGQTMSQPVGAKLYYALEVNENITYSFEGDDVAFKIEPLYPSCNNSGGMFLIPSGASKCRVYLSFSPPAVQKYNLKLKVGGVAYTFDGSGR